MSSCAVCSESIFSFFSREKCQRTVTLGVFLTSLLVAKEVSGPYFHLYKFSIRLRHVFLNHASYKQPHENIGKACKTWSKVENLRTFESF